MKGRPTKKGQNASGPFSKLITLHGALDGDIVARLGSGTSYAAPEISRRLATWFANFPAESRPDAMIQLRNALVHGRVGTMSMNFDVLLAPHHDAFCLEHHVPIVDSRPPAGAQYLLLLLPKKYREALLGDLEEEYRTVVLPRYGSFWAKVYYWVQVLWSFLSILWLVIAQNAFRLFPGQ